MSDNTVNAWRCTVCGYVHRGPEPPAECPVCGSPKEGFEPYTEPEEASPVSKSEKWRCLVCGYEHSGQSPPDECPVCGTPGDSFEALSQGPAQDRTISDISQDIVIIGAGIAGVSAAETVRQFSPKAKITMVSKETTLPYYRLNLTRFLAGEIGEETLNMHPESWYSEKNIRFMEGCEVSEISREEKRVRLKDSTSLGYDQLILTAGAHPFVPPIPGAGREGVYTLRSMNDARKILEESENTAALVIIGGGILGLETAGALARQGRKVSVLEGFPWLMPRQLNQTAAGLLKAHIEKMGAAVETGVSVQELAGDERVAGVVIKDGRTIPADLVVITAGVRSNSYLARMAGLRVNQGVIVDDFMRTSDPQIYAAGDIAEHRGIPYGLWSAAQYQGSIAGMNAVGKDAEFGGIPRANTVKVLGIDLLSIGRFEAQDGSDIVVEEESEHAYSRFLFRDTHLAGAILYGNTGIGGRVKQAIEDREDLSGLLKRQPDAAAIRDFFGK